MRCLEPTSIAWRLDRCASPPPAEAAPARFDAPLPLRVFFRAPGECTALLGETPTPDGAGVPVPAGPCWGVEPLDRGLDDAGLAVLAGLLRERGVPGLHLPALARVTGRGIASLASAGGLRWLGFECCWEIPGLEGLPLLRSLPDLVDLDLGSLLPGAEEIRSLPKLETLQSTCGGLDGEAFEALGGCPGLRTLDLAEGQFSDADLARLPALPRLESLRLGPLAPSSAALELLSRHAGLRCLRLEGFPLDAAAVDALARLPRLEHLHGFRYPERAEELDDCGRLAGLRILDGYPEPGAALLPRVARLPLLEELDLDGTDVGDGDLASLAGLRELRGLVLRNTWTTDAGLVHLAGLRRLEVLDLSLTRITDAGLACLEGRGNLLWLGLDLCAGITGRGLAHLPADAALADLAASGSGFDAAGLAILARLPALRWTNLNRTRIPPGELAAFLRERGEGLLYGDDVPR